MAIIRIKITQLILISFQLAQKLSLQEYQYKEFNAPLRVTELKDSLKNASNTVVEMISQL